MQTEIRIEAKPSARPTRGLEVFKTVVTRQNRAVRDEKIEPYISAVERVIPSHSFTCLYERVFDRETEDYEIVGISVGLAEVAHYLASSAIFDWPHHAQPMRLARRRSLATLQRDLRLAFDAAPVEDGLHHAGEEILREALKSHTQEIGTWLSSQIFQETRAVAGASILRLIGRIREVPASLRKELVRNALAADDVELRDAAVQAADQWGDESLLQILRAHRETEIWIKDYLERVIADLEAAQR